MFKNLNKKITTLIVATIFLVAGSAFAGTLLKPNSLTEAYVAKKDNGTAWSGWKKSTSVKGGDAIYFESHYFVNDCNSLSNIKSKLENLNGRTFNANSTENVYSYVDATGAARSNGSVNVHFEEKVKLEFERFSFQENSCKSASCETAGGTSTAVLGSGFNIGTRNRNDYGNIIVKFRVVKVNTPTPVDGGWTNWTLTNTGSYGTCSNGTKSRVKTYTRYCTNPAPANNGAPCSGSAIKTETETVSCSVESDGDVDTNSATSITRTSVRLNGDTDGTDVQDKWFAFSRTDSTPSCSSNSQRVEANGGDNFYKYKNGLTCNTQYYFRACGENSQGTILSSNVKEVRTLACEVEKINAVVTTQDATKIGTTSAQLNGYVDINDTENGRVYFVYGTSNSNMNLETGKSSVITDNTAFQSIVGLTPNTRYYYQAIIKDNGGIVDRGVIKTFVTDSNGVVITPINGKCSTYTREKCTRGTWSHIKDSSTQYKWRCNGSNTGTSAICILNKPTVTKPRPVVRPITRPVVRPVVSTPAAQPIEVVVVNETTKTVTKNYEEKGLQINKWVSDKKFGSYGLSTTAKIGDKVYYKIRIKNNSNKTIDNVEVKDFIPSELDMNGNSTNNVDKFATYILNLQPGQSKTVLTEMILSDNASVGDTIDSAAKINMDGVVEDTNSVSISVVDNNQNIDNTNDVNNNGQTASIFGANSNFFPSSIIGWMLLLILTLAFGLLVTRILSINTKE